MIQRPDGAAGTAPRNRIPRQELEAVAPMRSPRREVQVGLFVILGVLAVLVALFALTDPGTFRGRYYVTTVVETAEGIRKGDPVQLKGVNIGRIRDFELTPTGEVAVRLELQKDYPVPEDSRVAIVQTGILGDKAASIIPGASARRAETGDVLRSTDAAGGLLSLGETAGDLGQRADTVLVRAQQLLSQQTIGAVGQSAQELQLLLTELAGLAQEQRSELRALSGSLRRSAQGLEGAATRPELARAIARTDSLTLRLDLASRSLEQAGGSLATVIGRIERGEGTLGKLAADEELYDNLNATVLSVQQLTNDIRENPKKYISVSVF